MLTLVKERMSIDYLVFMGHIFGTKFTNIPECIHINLAVVVLIYIIRFLLNVHALSVSN